MQAFPADAFEGCRNPEKEIRDHGNFKVVIRVRPPLERELAVPSFQNVVSIPEGNERIALSEIIAEANGDRASGTPQVVTNHVFKFDHVYDEDSTQPMVYNRTARGAVISTLQGYNATILAYGQTGTGKTHTMEGFMSSGDGRGIIPRSMDEIFQHIEHCSDPQSRFLVRASYLQIYNEILSDLLRPERASLAIREDRRRGVFVDNLSEWICRTPTDVRTLMERGSASRATSQTKLNDVSSRSHAVFIVIVEQSETVCTREPSEEGEASEPAMGNYTAESERAAGPPDTAAQRQQQRVRVGKLNLVDLAGSERPRLTGATGQRLEETKKINMSLSALGNVIAALTDSKSRQHIPYRDSKLTRLLEDSLGGNCFTTMMAMVSPAAEAFSESLSTLKFAHRAKAITNNPRVNEDADIDQSTVLRRYETELRRLRMELKERSRNVVDKRRLLEVEDGRRRAEQDRLAAVTALEERSTALIVEKEEKRKLEKRIKEMSSQLLVGGRKVEDTPQFRHAVAEQERICKEYAAKLSELEKERSTIEEDKAQVDRYKQLLLKQRDIMIALTQRLHERDEAIIALQDEFDKYDRRCAELEDALDQKTAQCLALQRRVAVFEAGSTALLPTSGTASEAMAPPRDQKYPPENGVFDLHSERPMRLLTADEKVGELTALLDAQRQENHRLTLELEDAHADNNVPHDGRLTGAGKDTDSQVWERDVPSLLDQIAETLLEVSGPAVAKLKLTQDVMSLKELIAGAQRAKSEGQTSKMVSHVGLRRPGDTGRDPPAPPPPTPRRNEFGTPVQGSDLDSAVEGQRPSSSRSDAPHATRWAHATHGGAHRRTSSLGSAMGGRHTRSGSSAPSTPQSHRLTPDRVLGLGSRGPVRGQSGHTVERQDSSGALSTGSGSKRGIGTTGPGTGSVRRSASAGRVSTLRLGHPSPSSQIGAEGGHTPGSTGRRTPGALSAGSGPVATGMQGLSSPDHTHPSMADTQRSVDALIAKRKAEIRRICGSPRGR